MKRSNLVAVYGSLRQGMGNHGLLVGVDAAWVGTQRVAGFDMVSLGGYPAVCVGEGTILIEVYDITMRHDLAMARLDRLEGYPTFYNRMLIPTAHGDAWIYFMGPEAIKGRREVPDGDWVEYYGKEGWENE